MTKGFYKIAIRQDNALFFLAFTSVTYGHFVTRMEKLAEWFPSSDDAMEALEKYCTKTFKGNLNQVPIVIIKRIDCPLVVEKKYDAFDYFDNNSVS